MTWANSWMEHNKATHLWRLPINYQASAWWIPNKGWQAATLQRISQSIKETFHQDPIQVGTKVTKQDCICNDHHQLTLINSSQSYIVWVLSRVATQAHIPKWWINMSMHLGLSPIPMVPLNSFLFTKWYHISPSHKNTMLQAQSQSILLHYHS